MDDYIDFLSRGRKNVDVVQFEGLIEELADTND
jgi:hypothetical protein